MKERPILFSAPMVRAVLAGVKTQTRRALKRQPGPSWTPTTSAFNPTIILGGSEEVPGPELCGAADEREVYKFPYGRRGDRLWVKETWCTTAGLDYLKPSQIGPGAGVAYAAGGTNLASGATLEAPGKTRVSIFMPRWASRILLEITDVRVERLNDCSEADCIAEGAPGGHGLTPGYGYAVTPLEQYQQIWEQINGPGSWTVNPWVWVIEFRRK